MINFIFLSIKRLSLAFVFKMKRIFLLSTKPVFINFLITYECNSRCLMCDIWRRYKDNPKKAKEELTLDDLKSFIRMNKEWLSEVRHIGFTGGEPLLRSDIVEIIRLFRKQLPLAELGIQSNGLVPEHIQKKLQEIIRFYPGLSFAVSLDGLSKTHEKVRGVKNAFEKALKTIKAAQQLGIKDITTGLTISDTNFKEIMAVKAVAEKNGCEFSCFLVDEGDYFNNIGKTMKLEKEAKRTAIKTLKNFSYHYYMDNLRLQLSNKRRRQLPCYSGWASVVIDPYGEVKPCILRSESFGNIKRQSLAEILTSPRAREIRKRIKKCSCWSQCEVSTSAVVDPWDVVFWFIFYADKKEFLTKMLPKLRRLD
jgi:MoaA/NifB/PqqE/SkfB family radical SAM enzyme